MESRLYCGNLGNEVVQSFIKKMPENLKGKCKVRKIENRQIVVLKGNEIKNVYISCYGKMQVKNEFENGFSYSFASISQIAYIGVMELMADKKIYSSTLQSTTECTILEIPKEDFLNWIINDKEMMLEVLKFISRSMYDQSLKTGEGLAYPSICILMDYLINVFRSEDSEIVFLEKSREEIGSILGFSVRTINRNLKELKEQGLVTVTRKGILISEENFIKLCEKLESFK